MDVSRFIKLHDDNNRSYILDLGTIFYITTKEVYTSNYTFINNHSIEKIQEMIKKSGYTEDLFLYLHDKHNDPILLNLGFVDAFDITDNTDFTFVYFNDNNVNDIEVIETVDNIYKKIQTYKQQENDKNSYQPLITSQVNTDIDNKQLSINKYEVAQRIIQNNDTIYFRKIFNE